MSRISAVHVLALMTLGVGGAQETPAIEVNASLACGVEFSESFMLQLRNGGAPRTPFYPYSENCMASRGGEAKDEYCYTPSTPSFLSGCGGTSMEVPDRILADSWESYVHKKDRSLCYKCETPCHHWKNCPHNSQRFLYHEKVVKEGCRKRCRPIAQGLNDAPSENRDVEIELLNSGKPVSGICQCGCGKQGGCPLGQCQQDASIFCRRTCRPCCVGLEIGKKCKAGNHMHTVRVKQRTLIDEKHDAKKRALDRLGGYKTLFSECVATCSEHHLMHNEAEQRPHGSLSNMMQQAKEKLAKNRESVVRV